MKYILAVSGGIDSMTLLHLTVAAGIGDIIVATFDHGIRGEQSRRDAELVQRVCRDYGVKCVVGRGNLPADASEELARQKRYEYLYGLTEQYAPATIIAAHHQDDLIETVIINLIRGTGWRGLAPMMDGFCDSARNDDDELADRHRYSIIRPLLGCTKADLAKIAIDNNLQWHDDPTNFSSKYLRNRVRMIVEGWSTKRRQAILELISKQWQLREQIERRISDYCASHVQVANGQSTIRRYDIIMLPDDVALEVLRHMTSAQLTRPQLHQLLLFAKTAQPGKLMFWGDKVAARVDKRQLHIKV